MAKQTGKQVTYSERPGRVLDNIIRSNISRAKKDINAWRSALQQAENVDKPKRLLLYNLYDELVLDAHLIAEIDKRLLAFLGAEFNLMDEGGTANPEATALLKKQWFFDLMRQAWWSMAYGHSLIDTHTITSEGFIGSIKLVPRRHVIPEKGLIIKNQSDEVGLNYREDPNTWRWMFEIGNPDELGFLNAAAPHVLYKRFAQGAWTEFCELFGMPVRYAKTNTNDANSLNRLDKMLKEMATASYAVINHDEELEFIETAKSDGLVYQGLINLCDAALSKLVNGAVIGEASQGGSRSKEEVGLQIQQMKWNADKKWFESIMNEQIIPKLVEMGYPLSGLLFEFEKQKDTAAHWAMVKDMLTTYDIDPSWIEENFNVPVIQRSNTVKPTAKSKDFF